MCTHGNMSVLFACLQMILMMIELLARKSTLLGYIHVDVYKQKDCVVKLQIELMLKDRRQLLGILVYACVVCVCMCVLGGGCVCGDVCLCVCMCLCVCVPVYVHV